MKGNALPMVKIEFTDKQFRRLLDLVYIGNWILNSNRRADRFLDYDQVESLVFSHCADNGLNTLFQVEDGVVLPSDQFEDGGIHEAIMTYEDTVFFDILAEELARRDMGFVPIDESNYDELVSRIEEYADEFEENGINNITLER